MICSLEQISAQYEAGKEYGPALKCKAEEIANRTYRVAVIGEFKRGKSSLINSLLASNILPTDILPLTAAVTRIRYGAERKITVQFYDGRTEERTLEEIMRYATKAIPENARMAETVKEILVDYPSVLCGNHIEILDTPGLNDTEHMSEKTLSVLGMVDAAIVVISAEAPLSMTEQNLIMDLICEPGIRHLIFSVTFIDRFRLNDQERLLSYIRQRISDEVLSKCKLRCVEDTALQRKAEQILQEPLVYGVSSMLAEMAFHEDSEELLQQSRLPQFKEGLLSFLTAAQKQDIPAKTLEIAKEIRQILPKWKETEEQSLSLCIQYKENARKKLTDLLQATDKKLEGQDIPSMSNDNQALSLALRKIFIQCLSSITREKNEHSCIYSVLQSASQQAETYMSELRRNLNARYTSAMRETETKLIQMRQSVRLDNASLFSRLSAFYNRKEFPQFEWSQNPIPSVENLKNVDVMPQINKAINASLKAYANQLEMYLSSWRIILIQQIAADLKHVDETDTGNAGVAASKLAALPFVYQQHQASVEHICGTLEVLLMEGG